MLFGLNGKFEKYFDADGYHSKEEIVIEIEAGRAVANYQFLKDLFQASGNAECKIFNYWSKKKVQKSKRFQISYSIYGYFIL